MKFISIAEAIKKASGKVVVRGWIHRERGSNEFKFIILRDSSDIIQCVLKKEKFSDKWSDIDKLQIESSLEIEGTIKKDKRAPTGYEIEADKINIIGFSKDFPINKSLNEELLGDRRHLWLRSRKMTAIMKIRSRYVQAREQFFREQGFYRFDTPVLQPTQSEGGSTVFEVKYYDSKAYLAQTWQLYGEAAIFALEKVYNMGPTFRAEKSKTSRHLSEFWMAETEVAWWKLDEITEFAKKEIKYCLEKVGEDCAEEFKILGQDAKNILKIAKKKWPTIKYRDALKILQDKEGIKIPFGKDLRTIEEQKLMKHFDTPVVVTHYPKEVMAFYKPRDSKNKDEALCFDMLAPECGLEIVGGSERSLNIKEMSESLKKDGENPEDYSFYFDLRKYGSVPHSGYGVGIERVLQWICGLETIKDAIAFPRTMTRFKP
ncbi:asparagine--tRNA ligase [Candidatus Pacearchaeota archaeon]|nr:asparagine--tRNA ligase [Candidatus Pacearchaeota archaeon]